jgi:hypothetical protein
MFEGMTCHFDDEPFGVAQGRLREEEKSRTTEEARFLLAKNARLTPRTEGGRNDMS